MLQIAEGDRVGVFSASADKWVVGVVEHADLEGEEVQVRYTADGEERLKWVDCSVGSTEVRQIHAEAANKWAALARKKDKERHHDTATYTIGDRVKVFSASANAWLAGVVEDTNAAGEAHVRYQAGGEDRLKWVDMRDEQQIVADATLAACSLSKGDRVKVFSASANAWLAGVVEDTNAAGEAHVRYQADGTDRLKWVDVRDEQQVVADEKAVLATIDDGGEEEEEEDPSSEDLEMLVVDIGDRVKVYSASAGEWLSGVVEEVNRQSAEAQVRYTAGTQERVKWADLRDSKQIQAISSSDGVVQPEPAGASSDSEDIDATEDVAAGSLADRIDEALDPGCDDLESIRALLVDIHQSQFSHPALESLENKCQRLGGSMSAAATATAGEDEANDTSKTHQSAALAHPSEAESEALATILARKAEVEAAMQKEKGQKGGSSWKRRLSIGR